jgi:hypothetical protein
MVYVEIDVFDSSAAPQENPESTFGSGARVVLEIARDSADAFAPLKSVLGGLCTFVKHFDVRLPTHAPVCHT